MEFKQAQDLLISLYKREIDNAEFYNTQNEFDCYVQEFCEISSNDPENLSDEELLELASDFINDGGDYLISE